MDSNGAENDVDMEAADVLKEKATALFKKGDYAGAIDGYSAAIKACPSSVLYANRAAAKLMSRL